MNICQIIIHHEYHYLTLHVQEYPGVLFKVVIRAGNRSKQQFVDAVVLHTVWCISICMSVEFPKCVLYKKFLMQAIKFNTVNDSTLARATC